MTDTSTQCSQKILLLSEIFPPQHGGSGRWFSEIYGRFPTASVAFLVGEHVEANAFDRDFPFHIVRSHLSSQDWGVSSLAGLRYYVGAWRQLRKLVKQEKVTEVHCGRCLPEGLIALMLKLTSGIPYRCYVHGEDVEVALTSRELTILTRWVMRNADSIIANSQNSARILREKWGLPSEKIIVMTPGVDVGRFSPFPSADVPEGWEGKQTILTVGRLQRRKGQDMMIRALPGLLKRFPSLNYAIVGGGEDLPFLEGLVQELGVGNNVQFLGELNDAAMVNCYRHCTLFALPNRRVGNDDEGFGMVLLEAQACGRPVLAGASGGTRETLQEGVTGVLVDCTAPEHIVEALAPLLASPEKLDGMGREGRAFVEKTFDWDVLARNARELFFSSRT